MSVPLLAVRFPLPSAALTSSLCLFLWVLLEQESEKPLMDELLFYLSPQSCIHVHRLQGRVYSDPT